MLIILVISATWFIIGDSFDPSSIDYCKLKCKNGEVSSGCPGEKCYKHKEKNEIAVDDIVAFRQRALDDHNQIRDGFTVGIDPSIKYPKAANMHVLNYDLELEHILRCYILGDFVTGHDECRLTSYCKNKIGAGQNMYGNSLNTKSLDRVDEGIIEWFNESYLIPEDEREDLVKKFHSIQKYKAGHFTQMIWGAVTRIGCVRAWYPTNDVLTYRYVLGCNYAATDDLCAANFLDKPMYAIGEPCSQCGNEKCNNETGGEYDGLCGESKPVPTDPPTKLAATKKNDKKAEGSINTSNQFFLLLSAVVVLTDIS